MYVQTGELTKAGRNTYEEWRGNISFSFFKTEYRTSKMTFTLEHTFIFAAIFLLNIRLCFCACARAEYEINKECCPMCAPGKSNLYNMIIYRYGTVQAKCLQMKDILTQHFITSHISIHFILQYMSCDN